MAATVEQARAELAGGADVAGVSDPFATGTAAVSADGQTAYLDVSYAVDKLSSAQLDDAALDGVGQIVGVLVLVDLHGGMAGRQGVRGDTPDGRLHVTEPVDLDRHRARPPR